MKSLVFCLALAAAILGTFKGTGRLRKGVLFNTAIVLVAVGALMLCQPWGLVFYQDPFMVDAEKPFWAGLYRACLFLYEYSFGVLILGVVWFIVAAHLPDPPAGAPGQKA